MFHLVQVPEKFVLIPLLLLFHFGLELLPLITLYLHLLFDTMLVHSQLGLLCGFPFFLLVRVVLLKTFFSAEPDLLSGEPGDLDVLPYLASKFTGCFEDYYLELFVE